MNKLVLCISVAIASFANFVPEIVELLGNRPKYAGNYEVKCLHFLIFQSILLFLKTFTFLKSVSISSFAMNTIKSWTGC